MPGLYRTGTSNRIISSEITVPWFRRLAPNRGTLRWLASYFRSDTQEVVLFRVTVFFLASLLPSAAADVRAQIRQEIDRVEQSFKERPITDK